MKPFYDVDDIMKLMNCSRTKAYEYIRIIKDTSDIGRTKGRVMVRDFNTWAYGNVVVEEKPHSVLKQPRVLSSYKN